MEDEYYHGKESSRPTSKKRLTAKQEEYLQLLQERNRLKKQMAEKSHEAKINEERERGFSTHFAGANASDKKSGRSTTPVMTSRIPTVSGIPVVTASPQQQQEAPQRSRVRRGWGGEPVLPGGVPKQTRQPMLQQSPITIPPQPSQRRLSEDEEIESEHDHDVTQEVSVCEGEEYPEDFEYYYDSMEEEGPPIHSARSDHSEEEEELSQSVMFEDSLCNVESISVTKPTAIDPSRVAALSPPANNPTPVSQQSAQPSRGARRGWGTSALPTATLNAKTAPPSAKPTITASNDAVTTAAAAVGAAANDSDGSVARVLSQRLAALDEQKQQQLLLLLQQLEKDAPGEPVLPPTLKTAQATLSTSETGDRSTVTTEPKNVLQSSTPHVEANEASPGSASSSVTSQSYAKKNTHEALDNKVSLTPPAVDDTGMLPNSSSWQPVPDSNDGMASPNSVDHTAQFVLPIIRLRVHTNWKDTKYFSILHILLSPSAQPPSCASDTTDILSLYSTSVKVGLAVLPKYHGALKNISNLFSFSRAAVVPTSLPVEPPLPTEIILTPIAETSSIDISELVMHVYTVTSSQSDVSSLRDFDVFVDKTCLWSGEAENKSAVVSIPLKEKSDAAAEVVKHFAPSPLVTILEAKPVEKTEENAALSSRMQDDKPVWLTGKSSRPPSAVSNDIFDEKSDILLGEGNKSVERVSSSRRLTRRQSSEIKDTGKPERDVAALPISMEGMDRNIDVPSKPTTKPVPRRRNRQPAAPVASSDEDVRKSLDAIKVSGMRSRSRLQPSSSASTTTISHNEAPLYSSTLPSANTLPDTALESELAKPTESVSDKLKSRSQRISAVQDTVTNALANLSQVMSTLNRADSNKGLKRASSLEKLQEQTAPSPLPEEPATYSPGPDEEEIASLPLPSLAVPTAPLPTPPASPTLNTPLLPCGTVLVLLLHSNWGDPYYIGCNGIDIFDDTGDIAAIRKIESVPSDINILPEYADIEVKDPRVVTNLIDGDNFTRNDMHIWLAPHAMTMTEAVTGEILALQKQHLAARVVITFEKKVTISMIRLWNYNKSREHSNRGVRRVEVKLDENVIFDGEVKPAPGLVNTPDDCSEVILFTTDTTTLDNIAFYDTEQGYTTLEDDPTTKWLRRFNAKKQIDRPRTADKSQIGPLIAENTYADRPTTAAIRPVPITTKTKTKPMVPIQEAPVKPAPCPAPRVEGHHAGVQCRRIYLLIHSTWGDMSYVGLTGVEVLLGTVQRDNTLTVVVADLDSKCIAADDDLSSVGVLDDYRTADKLLDGVNNTTDDHHMWLIPYRGGGKNAHRSVVTIDLVTPGNVVGLRIWNYNKSKDDVLRGVKRCEIVVEGDTKKSLGGVELRVGPGCDGVSYEQNVFFNDLLPMESFNAVRCINSYRTPALKQDYETLQNPAGRLFKITLFSNHGDGYYIGLDGLQFLDNSGADLIVSGRGRVEACPAGLIDINVEDTRVVSNILEQPYSDPTGAVTWLAPLTHCMSERERNNAGMRTHPRGIKEGAEYQYFPDNVLYVMFDKAVSVSVIRFYNYSKTPKRGVRDFMVDCDGRTLYMGSLNIAAEDQTSLGQSIVFTNDPKLVRMEKDKVRYCGVNEQDVLCINEKQVMIRSKAMYETPNASTMGVAANIDVRPMTALAKE